MRKEKKWTKFFKVRGEDREFLFFHMGREQDELEKCKESIKLQGDMYRVTRDKKTQIWTIWDARI